jgi:hypothetical protein
MTYTLIASSTSVMRDADGAFIPADLRNADYQAYLVWAYGQAEADQLHLAYVGDPNATPPVAGTGNPSPNLAGLTFVNTPTPAAAPVAPTPSCQLWQLEVVMTAAQWAAAQAAITALNNPAVSAFFAHGTNVIPASSTTLQSLGATIGLSADQVTALVTQAAAVSIP